MQNLVNKVSEILDVSFTDNLREIAGYGSVNKVFVVESPEVGLSVLRFSKIEQIDTFEKEKASSRIAQKMGIQTPIILHTGTLEDCGYSFSLQRFAEGENGRDLKGSRDFTWQQLGEIAKHINAIALSEIEKAHLDSKITKFINLGETKNILVTNLNKISERSGCKREILRLVSSIEELPNLIKPQESCLIHGDLRPENVLVNSDSGSVVSVLDWGNSSISSKYMEMGSTFVNAKPNNVRDFLKGYGVSEREIDSTYLRIFPYGALYLGSSLINTISDKDRDYYKNYMNLSSLHVEEFNKVQDKIEDALLAKAAW